MKCPLDVKFIKNSTTIQVMEDFIDCGEGVSFQYNSTISFYHVNTDANVVNWFRHNN